MRAALITDLHFGARGDTQQCLDYYAKFYSETFFPTLEQENIKHVFILGDTFDRRKYTNHNTLYHSKLILFNKLHAREIQTHILVGNHDAAFKNTNEVNTVSLVLSEYDNIRVYAWPTTVNVEGHEICMLPWICQDNYADTMNVIADTSAKFCMGHLEVEGFAMYRGMEAHEGMSRATFSKFDMVFSGHYHHKSSSGNIHYLGNPYELTWNDYNDDRGFHILDFDNQTLRFIVNPNHLFEHFTYNDSAADPLTTDMTIFTDKYVKILVESKTDHYKFDKFIRNLYNSNPADVKIIEDFSEFTEGVVDDTIDLEDTQNVLSNYVDSINTDVNKDEIKSFLRTLYTEAVNTNAANV